MKVSGRTCIILIFALCGTTAFAVVPNFTCRPDTSKATITGPPSASPGPCEAKNGSAAAKSTDVVSASELSAQYADLKLSPHEVQNLILNAKTRSEHLRLAIYYGVRADDDQARAMHQLKAALKYRLNSSSFATGSMNQCIDAAHRLKQHATEMRKLQKEQEQLALDAGE